MSFNFAENLVSAVIPGLQSAAAGQTGLAEDTANAGGQAGASKVIAPGLDPTSLHNVTRINSYTSEVATGLLHGAGLQVNYAQATANSAMIYGEGDELGAAGLATVPTSLA